MLAAIVGPMGAGKTCLMTYLLAKDHYEKGREIFANYGLRFPGYKHHLLDFKMLLDAMGQQLHDASIGIDEAWLFFDSRNSQAKKNQLISHVLLQTRKRSVDVYATAQTFKQLDLRFRQNCDYVVLCRMSNDIIYARIFNRDTGKWVKLAVAAKSIYSLYDTDELVDPTMTFRRKALLNEAKFVNPTEDDAIEGLTGRRAFDPTDLPPRKAKRAA